MRNQRDETSSFDLFLDTICNTFGGIVFLAILLAVMIQNQSIVKTKEAIGEHATPEQVRQAMAQLEDLSAQWEQLKSSLAALPETASVIDDSEFKQLTTEQQELSASADEALQAETMASQSLAETLESNAVVRSQIESIPKEYDEAKKLLAEAQADYNSLAEAKQETLHVPRVRSSSLASILVLVQDGMIYLAKRPAIFGHGFNDSQVTTRGTVDSGVVIEPIDGSGWNLRAKNGENEFRNIVSEAKDQSYSITIAIWPNSYDQFTKLRDTMIGESVMYQLWPQSDGETLKIILTGGRSSVQ
ncbi:hypothetical protein [Novipirellula sp.]|uniref:hypothetical protein n=1 Tax=Novipirellula sp. TaxID=2795430 RepID=UPI0035635822